MARDPRMAPLQLQPAPRSIPISRSKPLAQRRACIEKHNEKVTSKETAENEDVNKVVEKKAEQVTKVDEAMIELRRAAVPTPSHLACRRRGGASGYEVARRLLKLREAKSKCSREP